MENVIFDTITNAMQSHGAKPGKFPTCSFTQKKTQETTQTGVISSKSDLVTHKREKI